MLFPGNIVLRPYTGLLPVMTGRNLVNHTSRRHAVQRYRERLVQRGMTRFEVLGRESDRELIRSLAKRLAENDAKAERLCATVSQGIAGEPPRTGGILEAQRRSPLAGADVIATRPFEPGRGG